MAEMPQPSVIVCGHPQKTENASFGNVRMLSHLDNVALAQLLSQAQLIVCRSGYSTLMDLHVLGKKALLVPTKGQAEQEYLARHFRDQFGWATIAESAIDAAVLRQLLAI